MAKAASRRKSVVPHANSRYYPVWSSLNHLLNTWEELETGNHSPRTVELWLNEKMGPAINKARRAMGREKPSCS